MPQTQDVVEKIATTINTVVQRFRERHPGFKGTVSLAAHGMAGVAAMDILAHQGDGAAKGAPAEDSGRRDSLEMSALPSIEDSDDDDAAEESSSTQAPPLPDLDVFLADAGWFTPA